MRQTWLKKAAVLIAVLVWAVPATWPQEKPAYTMAEYNDYQAAHNEKNAQQRAKLIEQFEAKYTLSTLLPYVYRDGYLTHYELKDFVKAIEYTDKMIVLGEKVDQQARVEAYVARAQFFYLGQNLRQLITPEQLNKTRQATVEGLRVVRDWQKPQNLTDEQYAQQKKSFEILLNSVAGIAELQLKDYKAAAESFRAALALDSNDALNFYRLGLAYLQMEPPRQMDAFWAMARSIALKSPIEAQVRDYLRKQLLKYQATAAGCEKEVDAQMNELLALAASSPQRPESYKISNGAELDQALQQTQNFLADLKAGGERGKLIWLATCGREFPELYGRLLEVVGNSDPITLKIYTGASQEEMEAATGPNSELKIVGQPEAKRLQKDDYFRYSATLVGYSPEPLMLRWDKGKVNPEDIPEEKAPGKAPAKRPTKRPPTKKPPAR